MMFQDRLLIAQLWMTNRLYWDYIPQSSSIPPLLLNQLPNKHGQALLNPLLKSKHYRCILVELAYIHCNTTLPPTNKLYIDLSTEY